MPSLSSLESAFSVKSFSCSRSDLPLCRQGAALAHHDPLPSHNLVIWTYGSVPFPFGKGGFGTLANCSLYRTGATLSFSAGPICSSFSAEACAILHALWWSRQHQQACHYSSLLLLSDFRSVLATLFSPPSFLLSQTLWHIWQELSSLSFCSIRLQWVPGHSFLPESEAADQLARRGVLLASSAIPCSLSSLISRIHSCFFSDWRRTVSSKFFDTQVPSISTKELVLLFHARCVLSCFRYNGHSLLLGSYLSRIGRIENPSRSACGHSFQDISHLILHCPATNSTPLTLWRLSVRPLVQALGSFPASRAPWSSAMPPSVGRGRVTNNNNNNICCLPISFVFLSFFLLPLFPAELPLQVPLLSLRGRTISVCAV